MPKIIIDSDRLQPFVGFVDCAEQGERKEEARKMLMDCLEKHGAIRYIYQDNGGTFRTSAVLTAFEFRSESPNGKIINLHIPK